MNKLPQKPYDPSNAESIIRYAKKLKNKSLFSIFGEKAKKEYAGKGGLGNKVEELYFCIKNNSSSKADFPLIPLELKTSPLKKLRSGRLNIKEPLSLGMINYMKVIIEEFSTSSFLNKNSRLLLLFYLWEKGIDNHDYIFEKILDWQFPENDLKVIKKDWQIIVDKVKDGLAHELSETDTLYLSARTKGASKKSTRKQPNHKKMAMSRAFALKSHYMNFIFDPTLRKKTEPAIKDRKDLNRLDFEKIFLERLIRYRDLSEDQIRTELKLDFNPKAKNRYNILVKSMLGISPDKKVEEFIKAGIEIKTVKFKNNWTLKESMSFPQIQFESIVQEKWVESPLFQTVQRRFLFIVYQVGNDGHTYLRKFRFWNMPKSDIDIVKNVWKDTKKKIQTGIYDDFIAISDDKIAHVRPKARNAKDTMRTPQGNYEKKKCFWLNSSYIRQILLAGDVIN